MEKKEEGAHNAMIYMFGLVRDKKHTVFLSASFGGRIREKESHCGKLTDFEAGGEEEEQVLLNIRF